MQPLPMWQVELSSHQEQTLTPACCKHAATAIGPQGVHEP